jgi:arginyl-tRNA synthetase
MNLFNETKLKIIAEIEYLGAEGGVFAGVTREMLVNVAVEPPRDASHGDMACNAAMVLAGQLKQSPRALADALAERLRTLDGVTQVDVAGAGFINLRFAPIVWQSVVRDILRDGVGYGNSEIGAGKKVNVEYVSANPTGPMHIGHARGAVVGDAMSLLLQKAGYDVTKEYYINDAGAQVDKLAKSAFVRYRQACGEVINEIPEGLYPGDYLIPVGEGLLQEYGRELGTWDEERWLPMVRAFTLDAMMVMIKQDLADLGIVHDVFTSEAGLHQAGRVQAMADWLVSKGLAYRGMLEAPKGKTPDDWEAGEQLLFKASEFGDDSDRPIQKTNGAWTYFAGDVAYTDDKLKRGFEQLVMVLGADHGGYVKRMQAVVKALSDGKASISVQLCQLVKFLDNGEPVKMSKRAGTFTTVRDVIEAVGKDVVRFIMLTRKPEQPLDFDLAKVTEKSRENPVFYVQYAHTRCKSLLRQAAEQLPAALPLSEAPTAAMLALLHREEELSLMRLLANWPRVVESAALAREAHRIAFYVQEVAAAFHAFWNLGSDNIALRFVQKDAIEESAARLALARAVATVIASGLHVLGVEPMEVM